MVSTAVALGLAYFPDLREFSTAIPVVGDALPAPDPLYLTSFGGAFLVSTGLALLAARLSAGEFDHDRLSDDISRLDDAPVDAGARPAPGGSREVSD